MQYINQSEGWRSVRGGGGGEGRGEVDKASNDHHLCHQLVYRHSFTRKQHLLLLTLLVALNDMSNQRQ